MRTAGDDCWNDNTYILPTLSVGVRLVQETHEESTRSPSSDSETTLFQLACKRERLRRFFFFFFSGRRPALGLGEEQSIPFPRQRSEPSVIALEMLTKKKRSQLLEGERALCSVRPQFLGGTRICEEVRKGCRCCGGKTPEDVRAQLRNNTLRDAGRSCRFQ